MPNVVVTSDRYTIDDPLYQWDTNKVLEIRGLYLPLVPKIHFTNAVMDRAIVRQAVMNSDGVISVNVPNTLLQKAYTITAYICIYQGQTFETLYKIDIPVKPRNKPNDYTFEDTDGEIYSFNALENQIANGLYDATEIYNATVVAKDEAQASAKAAAETLDNALAEAEAMIPNLVNTLGNDNDMSGYSIGAGSSANQRLRSISVPAKHCCIGQMILSNSTAYQSTEPLVARLYITDSATENDGATYAECYPIGDNDRLVMTYVLVNDTDSAKKFYVWVYKRTSLQPVIHTTKISEIFIPCTSN